MARCYPDTRDRLAKVWQSFAIAAGGNPCAPLGA
jgi:hypothetical protein